MAVTESNITVTNATLLTYGFTFPYLKTTDVKLSINGVASSAFSFANATTIQLNSNPTVGDKLRIFRDTDDSKLEAEFFAGSAIKSSDLNDNFNQNLYVTQESNNKIDAAWTDGDETIDSSETWASNNTRIATTGAIDGRVDSKIDTALTTDVAAGNKITVTDNSPGSGQITIGVTSGSLVNSDINASAAIAGTKISPDFGSQNIATTGTVDGRDVSNDGIKLDSIETGATADQNASEIRALVESATDSNVFTNADHTKLNAIEASATADQTASEIRTLVESASDSNVFTDDDHTKLNAIEAGATADQTVGEIKTLLAGSPLGPTHLSESYYTETELNAGQLDNRYYTETESDARYFNVSTGDTIKDGDAFPDNDTTIATTAAINDRIIDLVDDVGGFVPIANETSFPNANPDVNNGTGTIVSIGSLAGNLTSNGSGVITIANGTVGNSTVTITGAANSTTYSAGYGLLVETTSTLNTYTFHRLSSKATEVSTVAGNISNINAVANNASNINSAVSNASNINSAVSNASNINSAVSNASNINTVAGNNTNINTVAGANSNISTVAGSISNVNTAAGSIANINTVATNISNVNDFSDKYRVASSAPTSSLDTGDLYFDTSANELKVYNGSAWQGGVTATGNLAGLAANTFTGNQSLGDNLKVQLGAGNDLKIYHDGTKSVAANYTGDFHLRTSNGSGSAEEGIIIKPNGAVELYYDGSKKFETTSTGTNVIGVHVDDGATHDGDVSLNGASYNSWWDKSDSAFKFDDNAKIKVGTGGDLQLYHNGTDSYINHTPTSGHLNIRTDQIRISSYDGDEAMIKSYKDASTYLYYDGSNKFQTESSGTKTTGVRHWVSNPGGDAYIDIGTGATDDRYAYLDLVGDTTYTDYGLRLIRNNGGANTTSALVHRGTGALNIQCLDNAELRFLTNNSTRWRIDNGGDLRNLSDSYKLKLGASDDLQIYHDGSNSIIKETGTGILYVGGNQVQLYSSTSGETMLRAFENGAVELYYDNSKKLETSADGVTMSGWIYIPDSDGSNNMMRFGNGADLQIYHDGSNSRISNSTGTLYLEGGNGHIQIRPVNGEQSITAYANDSVELYYDNSKKLETTSDGATVSGNLKSYHLKPLANDTYDVGTSSLRWRSGFFNDEVDLPDNGKLKLGSSQDLQIYHDGTDSIIRNTTGNLRVVADNIHFEAGDFGDEFLRCNHDGSVDLYYDNASKLSTTATGVTVTGTVSDSKGDLRDIPRQAQSGAYTLVVSDEGKVVANTTGGWTIPTSVFAAGSTVTLLNDSASAQNVTASALTYLWNGADGVNIKASTIALGARSMATIWFESSFVGYIQGSAITVS